MYLHTSILSTCSEYTLELLLWLLGAFLLGYLLQWMLGAKYRDRVALLEGDLAASREKATKLEADLSAAKYDREKTNEELVVCKRKNADLDLKLKVCQESQQALANDAGKDSSGSGTSTEKASAAALGIMANASGDKSKYGTLFSTDNLQVVEGIGPKIENLLKKANITDWSTLAATKSSALSAILDKAGSAYRIHDTSSWPKQAKLASEANWQELISYQYSIGRLTEEQSTQPGHSKVEKLYLKLKGLQAFASSDLKVIEGVGPKIEALLKAAGIHSHLNLAETSVDKIKEVLAAAGERYRLADPQTWPKQAKLAAEGNWEELKTYQDFLNGGKE